MPLDYLKLDLEFIKDITKSKQQQSIVQSVIQLAHELHFKVVAEGVETNEQKQWLENNNCDIIQGYLYGKPLTVEEVDSLLGLAK